MRCRKVKAKIDRGDRTDPELLAHLAICPSCARLASAQTILDSATKSARTQAIDSPSDLAFIRAKVAAHQKPKEPIAMLKHAITSHPRLGFGLAVFIFAVLFLTLVPLPYQRISGYNVSFAGVEGVFPGDQLAKAMSTIGYEKVPVKVETGKKGVYYEFQSLKSLQAAKEVATAFVAFSKTKSTPWFKPNIETASASLYAQARNKWVQIEVDGTGKTDEQIKEEIKSKLAAQGFTEPIVYLKTDSTGKREIRLDINGSDSCYSSPPKEPIEIDTRGKTDQQIKAEVEAKLAAQGHPNAWVKINSEGADSTRKVEIQIEQKDTTSR